MIYLDFNTKTRVLKVSEEFNTNSNSLELNDVITIRCEGSFYEVIQSLDSDRTKAPVIKIGRAHV